ncbi:hypothetical protein ES703_102447 [subsurface metagenome]
MKEQNQVTEECLTQALGYGNKKEDMMAERERTVDEVVLGVKEKRKLEKDLITRKLADKKEELKRELQSK